jgi:hypothetical protein
MVIVKKKTLAAAKRALLAGSKPTHVTGRPLSYPFANLINQVDRQRPSWQTIDQLAGLKNQSKWAYSLRFGK